MQTNKDPVAGHCSSWIPWTHCYCWVCTTSSLADGTNIYIYVSYNVKQKHYYGESALILRVKNASRHRDLSDEYYCLPVKGNFVSKVLLTYKPVNNIIAYVGFSSFHAFNIYAAFGWIKVVLHHWSCWWTLPKEFISNLFPETWNDAIVCISATDCTNKHRDVFVAWTKKFGETRGKKLNKGKTSDAAQIQHVCLTYLLDSQETFCKAPDRSWNQEHEHPSSCHQGGNTFCP